MGIREIRESKRLYQGECADALGVSRPTYRRYEAEPERMTIAQCKALCEFLGCDVDEVFDFVRKEETCSTSGT